MPFGQSLSQMVSLGNADCTIILWQIHYNNAILIPTEIKLRCPVNRDPSEAYMEGYVE